MGITLKDPSDWRRNDYSRWSDLIEIHCLFHSDHYLTVDDARGIIFYKTESLEDELEDDDSSHAEQSDRKSLIIEDIFSVLKQRMNLIGGDYPFIVGKDSIELCSDAGEKKYNTYKFLLLCSNLLFLTRSDRDKVTKEFEVCSYYAMKSLLPQTFKTYIFGTSRVDSVFTGTVRARVEKLAELLHSSTTDDFNIDSRYDVSGGDAGLDLVSFVPLDDEAFVPLVLGQCACSYTEWNSKQFDLDPDKWKGRIKGIPSFIRMMFVPNVVNFTTT